MDGSDRKTAREIADLIERAAELMFEPGVGVAAVSESLKNRTTCQTRTGRIALDAVRCSIELALTGFLSPNSFVVEAGHGG